MYHVYNQFKEGGDWFNLGFITDVSDATHFTGETAVQSGDWFVVEFYTQVSSQTIQMFVGGVTGAGALGPYTAPSAGVFFSMGFTGGWSEFNGFTNDSGIFLLSNYVGEAWKFHMLIRTDICCFILIGARQSVSAPNLFDLGVYAGQYITVDSADNYPSLLLVGNPYSSGASEKWNDAAAPPGRSYEVNRSLVVPSAVVYVGDGTMLGKDSSNLMRSLFVHVFRSSTNVGLLGALYGIYQCRNTGITDGDTATYSSTTYINSHDIAVIWS
jgi:hypothetical protein